MMPLRELLMTMTTSRPPERVVDEFVRFCKKTALVLLARKVAGGKLCVGHLSLSLDDIAMDCVADLFSRGNDGSFIQLEVYLRGIDIGRSPEAELMSYMRRLIFAKVNQGIYRIYHEIDPSLSRIIRNIKISIHALENFLILDRFGETIIVPAACNSLEHLPMADPAVLREELRRRAGRSETVPGLMGHLACYLREQSEHSRMIPLVEAALIFRSLYPAAESREAASPDAEMAASISDARGVIARACAWVKERGERKYVGSGKVDSRLYGHYFAVIEKILVREIVDQGADGMHYYEELDQCVPGLTREEYAAVHKSRIEYLGRLAHRRAIRELRKVF